MATETCATRVWSGACEHAAFSSLSEKYLCDFCETRETMDHEVCREGFVHIQGGDTVLSWYSGELTEQMWK